MLENLVRVTLYVIVGTVLFGLNIWFLRSLQSEFAEQRVVIAPFHVIGNANSDSQLGEALAFMLRARLMQIQHDLEGAQTSLSQPSRVVNGTQNPAIQDPLVVPLSFQSVNIPFRLFAPLDIHVSVGGVEVGGAFSWLQRATARPDTLEFTVYLRGDEAIVTGNLDALGQSHENALWTKTSSDYEDIVDQIAFAIIQRELSKSGATQIALLEVDEVQTLLTTYVEVAELNRKMAIGRMKAEYEALLVPIERLVLKVTQWYEPIYLAAIIAERAGDSQQALIFYRQVQQLAGSEAELVQVVPPAIQANIEEKIQQLSQISAPSILPPSEFVKAMEDYSRRLGLTTPLPKIVFVELDRHILAQWNPAESWYEVNPDEIDLPGAAYAALMGRFFEKNYDRCLPTIDPNLWNNFRLSTSGYLLQTDSDAGIAQGARNYDFPLFHTLKRIESGLNGDTTEPVRRLALALLEQFDCDWANENLENKVLAINRELNLMPNNVIQDAFNNQGDSSAK